MRVSDFEQIAAVRAAEVLTGAAAEIAAGNAPETEFRLPHTRR